MRARTPLALVAAMAMAAGLASTPTIAGGRENPDGYGLYSPRDAKRKVYRYDPRSWYYSQPGHYPYYASGYWVPRAEMRYRYRRSYYGPRYRYYPAWGYPLAEQKDR
jgi:hypothetical protein